MRFVGTLNDIFEEIFFSVLLVFNILEDKIGVDVIRDQHKFGVRTIGGERLKRIFEIGHIRFIENAVG